ncbi:MAG: hypothetical protein M1380_09625 [Chloroflexi bacterium]|nr:hypothetical protein [Chloroflexota bacterium]
MALEIVAPPSVPALYFWALQVDFIDGLGMWGGGHTGLQWNRRYPGGTAVNWGGYASAERGGAVLPGSISSLPGFEDDPNTLAYTWEPGRPYRVVVRRSPEVLGAWRAEVADLVRGESAVVRDLYGRRNEPGFLGNPMVWSEVFADCDAPSVTVRWAEIAAIDEEGAEWQPEAVVVNYQTERDGGCVNTDSRPDPSDGIIQVTNVRRAFPQGARIPLR